MSEHATTMKPGRTAVVPVLTGLWLCAISAMTVWKFAPDVLNADILINTVMSLQKLTLYYWGQNRLLNVLPWATAWLRDPAANLFAVLWLASLSCFALLYLFSRFAARVAKAADVNTTSLQAFVVMSAGFVITFTPYAIGEIAIWHIEYALAALLCGLSFYLLLYQRPASWSSWLLPTLALIVAMGLNPSTVIPAVFVVLVMTLYRRRIDPIEVIWAGLAILTFVAWNYVSRQFGEASYSNFHLSLLLTGTLKVLRGLLESLRPIEGLVFAGCAVGLRLLARSDAFMPTGENGRQVRYITIGVTLFSLGWLLLFSTSGWVAINQFPWRYFIYVIFALLFLASLFITHTLLKLNKALGKLVVVATALAASVATCAVPISFDQYKVFQKVNALTRPGGHLYAGDYWLVWPSVLRDMLHQQEAYGLTFRGEANRDTARAYMTQHLEQHGHVRVYCLGDPADTCVQQIERAVGQFEVAKVQSLSDTVQLIELSSYQPGLRVDGRAVLSLPSAVGKASDGARITDGQSGFLLYGPYRILHAGHYRLRVHGTSRLTEGAYVDLASRTGRQIHAKFELLPNAHGELVRNAVVHFQRDVTDLEVRVWVDERNEVEVSGYELQLLPNEMAP